jgi:hypothetical protein
MGDREKPSNNFKQGPPVVADIADWRARFGDYPDAAADDLFVDQCFGKDEIDIVGDEPVVVMAPAHYRDLLKMMRRAYRGAAETRLATEGSARPSVRSRSTTRTTLRDVLRLCRGFSGSVDAATYALVAISARVHIAFGGSTDWERDESSRTETATPRDPGADS